MHLKIQGGTANHDEPTLCCTCRFATIVKGHTQHQIIECSRLADGRGRITFKVTSCTTYSDGRQPSLHHMEDVAWILRSDPKRNSIGFVRPRNVTIRERFLMDED